MIYLNNICCNNGCPEFCIFQQDAMSYTSRSTSALYPQYLGSRLACIVSWPQSHWESVGYHCSVSSEPNMENAGRTLGANILHLEQNVNRHHRWTYPVYSLLFASYNRGTWCLHQVLDILLFCWAICDTKLNIETHHYDLRLLYYYLP